MTNDVPATLPDPVEDHTAILGYGRFDDTREVTILRLSRAIRVRMQINEQAADVLMEPDHLAREMAKIGYFPAREIAVMADLIAAGQDRDDARAQVQRETDIGTPQVVLDRSTVKALVSDAVNRLSLVSADLENGAIDIPDACEYLNDLRRELHEASMQW